jgi:hypothetical protein
MAIEGMVFMFYFFPERYSPWAAVGQFCLTAITATGGIWIAIYLLEMASQKPMENND